MTGPHRQPSNYKNEFLFIRGIDKYFKYFSKRFSNDGIFKNNRVNIINNHISRFEKVIRLGYLNNISDKYILEKDVYNSSVLFEALSRMSKNLNYLYDRDSDSDDEYIDDIDDEYPGFKNIFATLELFLSKFKINYVDEIDRDSDNDYVNEIDRDSDNDDDIDIDSDSILAP